VSNEGGVCVFRATIYDEDNNILGTGTAYENEKSSYINKTSYIENCETSAVGRALGMCGFGIDTSIASADEVVNAINNQGNDEPTPLQEYKPKEKTPRQQFYAKAMEKGIVPAEFAAQYGINKNTPNEAIVEILQSMGD
jgi:hypothetical protein